MKAGTKKLIEKLNDHFINNGNARYIDFKGAEKLLNEFEKEVLTDFLEFLLKNGYCDSDVYTEPPTAIDQYLIFDKK